MDSMLWKLSMTAVREPASVFCGTPKVGAAVALVPLLVCGSASRATQPLSQSESL